jgi:hypothetical protein
MLAVSHHLKMGRVLNERKTVGIDQSTVHTYQPMSLVINSR